MTPTEYANKKNQYNKLMQDVTKAEGATEEIMKRLKSEFGINSKEELTTKIKALNNEKIDTQETLEGLYERLEGATDWSKL